MQLEELTNLTKNTASKNSCKRNIKGEQDYNPAFLLKKCEVENESSYI